MGLIAEIALHQGNRALAETQLKAVLADNPLALRERVMLSDLLLQSGQPKAARDLLVDAPDTDGVLIRRILAARALGDTAEDARLVAILDKRFALNIDLGLTAHAREEGLYFLTVAHDTAKALTRAKVNWALQHEVEDAVLLLQAAEATDQSDAAQPVRDWMALNGVVPRAK
jgi:hypothetical protein